MPATATGTPAAGGDRTGQQPAADDGEWEVQEDDEEVAAVREAHAAAMEARFASAEAPREDDPAIAQTHVGGALEHWEALVGSMIQSQPIRHWAIRYPADSPRHAEAGQVTFSDIDGTRVALVGVCVVDDGERVRVGGEKDGELLRGSPPVTTIELTDTMLHVDGAWKLAGRQQHSREEGVTGCADEAAAPVQPSRPPPAAEDEPGTGERDAVTGAWHAANEASIQAHAAPWPSPEHPALGETHTGTELVGTVINVWMLLWNGLGERYPPDSQARAEVLSVDFDDPDDPGVAYVEVCAIGDSEAISLETGQVSPFSADATVQTIHSRREMHQVDGRWKVAEWGEVLDEMDDIGGCALDLPPVD